MIDSQTITLPRHLYFYTPVTTRMPTRLDRIVARQLAAQTRDSVFAFGLAAFAMLVALGIAG